MPIIQRPGVLFLALAALVAPVFWLCYARTLQYGIYNSADTYLYSEDYTQGFRVCLTVFVSLVAASPVWLVHAWRRRNLPD